MMENTLWVSSSPHIRDRSSTGRIMMDVVIALIPALLASVWFFGLYALLLTTVTTAAAFLSEWLYNKLMKRPQTVKDFSALVTGLLMALNLPPDAPLWIGVVGSVIAVIVIKQIFGGLGQNFMNPALGARVILLLAWPVIMTRWILPQGGAFLDILGQNPDVLTGATPLLLLKTPEGAAQIPSLWDLLIGNRPGSLGETSALALLLGALYLGVRRVIDLRMPLLIVAVTVGFAWIFGGKGGLFTGDALTHALSGSLILGAFFMATDYSTAPGTPRGRLVYALGIGFLTGLIRVYTNYPEGVSFAIILMNCASPLIERLTIPKSFGGQK